MYAFIKKSVIHINICYHTHKETHCKSVITSPKQKILRKARQESQHLGFETKDISITVKTDTVPHLSIKAVDNQRKNCCHWNYA